ncbi:hypothetical protein N665_0383s0040 [Sinapis alba]|nr:hypothetical protein N665_0383s0040 [Sinapis alba]
MKDSRVLAAAAARAGPVIRKQVLTLTDEAAYRVHHLLLQRHSSDWALKQEAATIYLTLSITQGLAECIRQKIPLRSLDEKAICCYVPYEKGKFDELVEEKGVRILVEPKALMHVIGTKMDFIDDKLRSEFVFINPKSQGQCGCGESFMTTSTSSSAKQSG